MKLLKSIVVELLLIDLSGVMKPPAFIEVVAKLWWLIVALGEMPEIDSLKTG